MASEPPKVFISYNRADRNWAEWIAGAIEPSGYYSHRWEEQPVLKTYLFRYFQKVREPNMSVIPHYQIAVPMPYPLT